MKKIILFLLISSLTGCSKMLDPQDTAELLPADAVFRSEPTAAKAMAGLQKSLSDLNNTPNSLTILAGLSADDFIDLSEEAALTEFETNTISPDNPYLPWSRLYNIIYQSNAAIEALRDSSALDPGLKRYFAGEAKFIRAYCYFLLVNFFENVPLILTTRIDSSRTATQSSPGIIYQQIITDLLEAADMMDIKNFDFTDKTSLSKWTAFSLLARAYLYTNDYINAAKIASSVIASGHYRLLQDIDQFAELNNQESIYQFAADPSDINLEVYNFLNPAIPGAVCTPSLVQSFEEGDSRKEFWLSVNPGFLTPAKYNQSLPVGNERHVVFRLAEQYLIRAEALAQSGNVSGALADLNILRARVKLSSFGNGISKDSCITLVFRERRCELFAEGYHRWFDLKRSGLLDQTLRSEKNGWSDDDRLYPIPRTDIQRNSRLQQNPGY